MRSWCRRSIPPGRRFVVAAVALGLAASLFHGQLASGLVTRGDDFLQTGRPLRALVYYRRALAFDAHSTIAAERFAFTSLMMKRRPELREAVAVASAALETAPDDAALLSDRALCLNALGDYRAALRDFWSFAERSGDVRYYEFAAQAARRAGERARAVELFERVLKIEPRFVAARRALARLGHAR